MRPNWITQLILATALVAGFQVYAQDVEHGRVSYVDDDGLIRGNGDDEWSVAQLNSLVMPGDAIWADESGVLEVEVSGGTFVRLADSSKIEVASMPPVTRIKGWSGSFYVQRLRQSEGDFVFEAPVGDIRVENDSQVRFDVLDEGSTTVTVRWGSAIIHSGSGTLRVGSGKRVYIDPGYLPSPAETFDRAQEDSFDTWNRERARTIANGANRVNIGSAGSYSTPIGAYDLDEYGDWIYEDNQQYWRPTVVREYVPYRTGSWSYVANHGHVWVGHHPFTYITSHHGYWHHHHRHGWIWSYNPVYSPAYVASVRHNDVFIWAPLSIHGDAVYSSGGYFTAGGFHFSIGWSSYAYSHHLLGGYTHAYPAHHYHHISHHHHYNAHHWDLYSHKSKHHRHRPHRNAYHSVRDYTPQRVMRGPSSVNRNNASYEARNRASVLEQRVSRTQFSSVDIAKRSNARSARTSVNANTRQAHARNVTFSESPTQRISSRNERLRSLPGDGSVAPRSRIMAEGAPSIRTAERNPTRTVSGSDRFKTIGSQREVGARSNAPTARTEGPTSRNETRGNVPSARTETRQNAPTARTTQREQSEPSRSTRIQSPSERPAPTTIRGTREQAPTTSTQPRSNRGVREQAPTDNSSSRFRTITAPQRSTTQSPRPEARSVREATPKSYNGREVTPQVRQQAPVSSQRETIRLPQSSSNRNSQRQATPRQSAPPQTVTQPRQVAPQPSAPRQSVSQPRQVAPRQSAPAPRSSVSEPRSTPRVSAPSTPRQRSSAPSSSSRSSSGGSRSSRGPR